MHTFSFARYFVAILIAIVTFISCDDQISDFGSEVLVGTEIIINDTIITSISTQEINTNSVRSNNLSYNILGRFESENYTAKYDVLGQVFGVSASFSESFVEDDNGNQTITTYDLVAAELVIPYRYTLDEIDTDEEEETYTIDSKVNGSDDPILDLTVFQTEFSALNSDPESSNTQLYFTDKTNLFDDQINPVLTNVIGELNNFDLSNITNSSITIDYTEEENKEIECGNGFIADGTLTDDEKWVQLDALRIPLYDEENPENSPFLQFINELLINEGVQDDTDGFTVRDQDAAIDISSAILADTSIYKEFPGIYIQTKVSSTGTIEVLPFNEGLINAGILLTFIKTEKEDVLDETDDDKDTCTQEVFYTTILMNTANGRAVNFIDKETEATNTDDETILLQSGQGSIGLLTFFKDNLNELNELVEQNDLLNDAELVLTVNRESSFFDSSLFEDKVILDEANDESVPLSDDDDYDEDSDTNYCNIMITQLTSTSASTLTDYNSNLLLDANDTEASLQQKHLVPLTQSGEDLIFKINITEYLASVLDRDPVFNDKDELEDDENILLEDLISEEALQLVLSPTNDITLTTAARIKDVNLDGDQEFVDNIFVNQGSVLSFETIPIYGSNASDESKRPRIIVKYTSTK